MSSAPISNSPPIPNIAPWLSVRDAQQAVAFYAAATDYLKKNDMPADPRLLDRLLGHPDEDTVDKALSRLEEMHKAGTLKAPPALRDRLASVELETGDPKVRRRAAELRKALR